MSLIDRLKAFAAAEEARLRALVAAMPSNHPAVVHAYAFEQITSEAMAQMVAIAEEGDDDDGA